MDWSLAKGEINQLPVKRLSGMSGRQLDIEETLECARLCLDSEAKLVLRRTALWGNCPVDLGGKKVRLDITRVQHGSLGFHPSPVTWLGSLCPGQRGRGKGGSQ